MTINIRMETILNMIIRIGIKIVINNNKNYNEQINNKEKQ